MPNYITLLGVEQVQSAANAMGRAAENMNNAAANISHALEIHHRFMDDWLIRLERVLEKKDV